MRSGRLSSMRSSAPLDAPRRRVTVSRSGRVAAIGASYVRAASSGAGLRENGSGARRPADRVKLRGHDWAASRLRSGSYMALAAGVGGAARPPPPQAARRPSSPRPPRRPVRALRPGPALARARRGRVRAADVGLPRDVRDAQRRPGGARAAREGRLPGARRPLHRRSARRRRCGSSARSAGPGASAAGRRCSSGRTGSGSCSRTAPSPTCCCATRSASRAARRTCTRRSTSG